MKDKPTQSRKQFLHTSAALTAGLLFSNSAPLIAANTSEQNDLNISIFSKHLQFLNYKEMAEAAKEMGFHGVDLTVRPKGHVLPQRVAEDLPKAAEALNKYGLSPNLFTSNVWNANDPLDQNVLNVAADQGFQCYRTDWLKYSEQRKIEQELAAFNIQMKALAKLNETLGLKGSYQNHAGTSVGSPVWDIKTLLKGISPKHLGVQYDIRHATVEGANSWELGFELLKNQINTMVLKDFKWGKVNGKWQVISTPMGQGMVDFKRYFKMIKQNNIDVPVSLHLEYDLGGAEKGRSNISISQQEVFKHMKEDLMYAKKLWNEA